MLGRKILAFVWKDVRLFSVDRQAVVMSFVVPILIASILGWLEGSATSGSPAKGIPLLVVDQDGSAISKGLLDRMTRDGTVKPQLTTLDAAKSSVQNGAVAAGVVIPPGFGAASAASFSGGPKPTLTLLIDPTKPEISELLKGTVIQQAAAEVATRNFGALAGNGSPPFETRDEQVGATQLPWAGAAHRYVGFGIQGLFFFAMEAAVSLARERQMGIWRRLAAAPVSAGVIVWSKALSSFVIALAILLGMFAFGALVFGIRILGSIGGFAAVSVATAAMAAGFGLAIATIGRTETQSRAIAILLILVMLATGGAWFPMDRMPSWVQAISDCLPVRWAVEGLDAATWRGLGLEATLRSALVLSIFAVVFLGLATWRFQALSRRTS